MSGSLAMMLRHAGPGVRYIHSAPLAVAMSRVPHSAPWPGSLVEVIIPIKLSR